MLRLSFYPLFGSYTAVAVMTALLAAVIWMRKPGMNAGLASSVHGQRILLTLRYLALTVLLFAMLRPVLVYTASHRLAASVQILLDRSQSMSRNDEIGGATRFNTAKKALDDAAPQLRQLARYSELKAFTFDTALAPLECRDGQCSDLPEIPDGAETAVGFILDQLRERSAGKRILAAVMLTDGAQRTRPSRDILPQDAAGRLRDAGIPLYTVPLGQAGLAGNTRDISVDSVQSNDRVFVKNKLQITGTIRITGFTDQKIPVQLLFETNNTNEQGTSVLSMEAVAQTEVQAKEDGQAVPFHFSYAPQHTGVFKYTVKVPPQEKELSDRNNEQSGFIRVVDGGLKVLFIQGQRNFEQGPLRQSLHASPDINVNYLRIDKKGGLLHALHDAVPYNVFILDSIDAAMFTPEELRELTKQVKEDGAGLILLGGLYAFGAGGYADTPLAEVSPFVLSRADRQPPNQPIRQDIHWSPLIPIPMQLTDSGKRHFVLRLDPNPKQNEERWTKLPPLMGANRLDKLKPGAVLLAAGTDGQKLLAAQMSGLGRVLAFAGDSTYRWRLAGFTEEHKTFWRQVVLWLAKMEGGGSGDCWIVLESSRLFPGDPVKFQVFMRNKAGEEVRNFPVKVSVLKPDHKTENAAMVTADGVPTGSFRSTEFSGDYVIRAETELEGETKTAETRFLVQNRNLELDNPAAYPKLLSDIASVTGGKSVPHEQFGALITELIKQSGELVEKRETKTTLYDHWTVLLLFVLLLASEWFLRKYWGLV
ncbi:MAG: hypothetical protein LBH00_09640 [Planctomycetaceae bacterium]|jgi:hypothetical protein|nr:hypothetical protein [Planctomycetaceae bacterium]